MDLRLKDSDKGTSLIELVIAMAIAAIVLSMIMFFMDVSARSFRKTSSEVNLQLEAQTTINQLSNLAMEAQETKHPALGIPDESRYIFKFSDGRYTAIVYNFSDRILYLIEAATEADAQNTVPDKREHYLAEYVSSLDITESPDGKTVIINLKLALGKDTYQISKKVKLRNALD